MNDNVYINADFDVIDFMKHINRLMFGEEMIKLGIKPIELKPLPKPEMPLWMKCSRCSCCGNYIIIRPKFVNVRRGRCIKIVEVAWNALILGNKEVMKEAGVNSKTLCIKCLYTKSNNIACNFFAHKKQIEEHKSVLNELQESLKGVYPDGIPTCCCDISTSDKDA